MTKEDPLLTELNLFRPLIRNLHREGFYRLDDLRPLSTADICTRVSGRGIKRLIVALGREPVGKDKAKKAAD